MSKELVVFCLLVDMFKQGSWLGSNNLQGSDLKMIAYLSEYIMENYFLKVHIEEAIIKLML